MKTIKYQFINSLRGLAIIMVIFSHLHFIGLPIYAGSEAFLIGVSLFFVISTYTLSLSQDNKPILKSTWRNFYIKRFFRIYPVFFVVITVVFLLSLRLQIFGSVHEGVSGVINYLSHITFTYGLSPYTMNTFHLGEWSLFSEAVFYILFPMLFIFMRKSWSKALMLFIASIVVYRLWENIALASTFTSFTNKIHERWLYVYHFPLYHLPDFIMGFILFHLHRRWYNKPLSMNIQIPLSILHLAVFCYAFYMNVKGIYINNLIRVILFGVLVWLMMQGGGIYAILNNKIFSSIGNISYSLYLLNLPIFFIAGAIIYKFHFNPIIGTIVAVIVLGLLASLTYRIELWGISFGKRFER